MSLRNHVPPDPAGAGQPFSPLLADRDSPVPAAEGQHTHRRVKRALRGLWLFHRQHGTLREGHVGWEVLQGL